MVDLAVRALLVLAALACVLLGAPQSLTAVAVAAASLAVVEHLAARRQLGGADALLVGVGALLSVLVLTGLGLHLVGVPLRPAGWAVALGALGLGALLVTRTRAGRPAGQVPALTGVAVDGPAMLAGEAAPPAAPPGADPPPGPPATKSRGVTADALFRWLDAPWVLACAAVLAVAITLSIRSVSAVEVSPVQLSVRSLDGVRVQVQVSSDTATGPLELRADTGNGAALSYPLFRLPAGGSRTTEVLVPARGRALITLNNPGQTQPLRSLVVDR